MKGLVHIYTGDGKGKTTAALGLGIRAYGRGFKVIMFQFLKGSQSGEMKTIEKLSPEFELRRGKEVKKFTWNMSEEELQEVKKNSNELFNSAVEAAQSGKWDLLILDEIMGAMSTGLVDVKDVADLIKNKPGSLEVVMTGRNAPDELTELADYVSEIKAVKHPFNKGIPAREGIES
ncbi:MAG: cob(I)yrinic acid a,c-diamide adenosyltransferase [Clostridia bacterium]|nr:cob(I)yrinic acid a,c-diamide adenosyltransferase [Clostridia bacterium]